MNDEQLSLFPKPGRKRRGPVRDEIWNTLSELFGEPTTRRTYGRRCLACLELREAGATPEEIRLTFDYCRRYFGHFTELAISMYHGRALHERRKELAERSENVIDIALRKRIQERGGRL